MNKTSLPSPAELDAWRELLHQGHLPAPTVERLLDAVAGLRAALDTAEKDATALAAVALGRRLSALDESRRCSACGDAEAHRAAAWLRAAAGVSSRR